MEWMDGWMDGVRHYTTWNIIHANRYINILGASYNPCRAVGYTYLVEGGRGGYNILLVSCKRTAVHSSMPLKMGMNICRTVMG